MTIITATIIDAIAQAFVVLNSRTIVATRRFVVFERPGSRPDGNFSTARKVSGHESFKFRRNPEFPQGSVVRACCRRQRQLPLYGENRGTIL
jgi:hypothetical protein